MWIHLPQEYRVSKEQSEKWQWAEWIYNSHKWIETNRGYFTCEFCSKTTTSEMPLPENPKLCEKNPYLHINKK